MRSVSAIAAVVAWLGWPGSATLHELPVVTGIAVDGTVVALRTTRGFVLRDASSESFVLQCLEYSGLSPTESPAFDTDGERVVVASVGGIVVFDATGCGLERPTTPGAVAMADVRFSPTDGWTAVSSAAGTDNDVFRSQDGISWQASGFDLSGFFAFSVASSGTGTLATGVTIDTATSRPAFVLRRYAADGTFAEQTIDSAASTHRVVIADVSHIDGRVLLWVDRLETSDDPDWFAIVGFVDASTSPPTPVFEWRGVHAARLGDDGDLWLATDSGVVRRSAEQTQSFLDGTPVTALGGSQSDPLWIATEYSVDGFALAGMRDDGSVVEWLKYEQIAGPTECADSPGTCAADWVDWSSEIPASAVPAPSFDAFFDAFGASGSADAAGGCVTARGGAWTWLVTVALLAVGRRRQGAPLTR